MSCCNKKPLIIPDPTINLQRVVDNGNRLQGVIPTQSQVIQYDNGNVVWNNLVVPTLQQVLTQGNIATDKTIELDSSNNIIHTTVAHNKITIDNSIDSNELTANNQTFTDISNNTTVLNATSITIDGIGIFSATSNDITIENGTNSIVISNGATNSLGIRINGNIICPEYAYFLTHTPSVIPTISSSTPFKITFYNNGVDILDNFVQNPNLFTASIKTTAIYEYSGYLVVGTEVGECFYWSGSAWNKFAEFNGPITSFAKSTFNNYLYIGGSFTSQDSGTIFACNNIAVCSSSWICFAVTNSNTGALGFNGKVNCLTESYSYTNLLFVGGEFTTNGSVAFYRFAILDFNSAFFNNPYFRSIDWSYGPSGGFDGPVNTISSYSNYVFIGGAFSTATAYPLSSVPEVDNYPYGVLWQSDSAGNSYTTPAFSSIGGSTGISKEVTCSYFNPGNSRFCIGFNGLSVTFNNYLEFVYDTPNTLLSSFSPSSEITSIYVNYDVIWSVYFADISGNVYRNGVLFGDSSTRGNQAITSSSQFSKICFATTLDNTNYGFYIWSLSNNIIYCNFPSITSILYNGAPTNATGITMAQKGSYFSMYWDGSNYQYSNQNYATFIY